MEIIKVNQHNPNQSFGYLFDTNVWLYIYGPVAGSNAKKQRIYSNLLNSILERKAVIFITSLVLSEYINRVLRIGFQQWKDNGNYSADYKHDYRATDDYKDNLADAIAQVEDILKITQRRPDDFNAMDINAILAAMSQSSDYNDSYLVKCCENANIKFVSDDRDIISINSPITVIQA